MMHGRGKSDFAILAVKPAAPCGAIRGGGNCGGASGAKGGDQGECGPAKHVSEPGKRVTGAGTHTANICRYDPR
jgi:hypothetical protein